MNNLLLYTATAILRCPTSEVKIDIFCNCRLPQEAKLIAECDQCGEWFHDTCENIPGAVWKRNALWLCTECFLQTLP